MSRKKKILLAVGILGLIGVVAIIAALSSRDQAVEVRAEEIRERNLVTTITATGSVRPRRQVSISSDEMGRVAEVRVEEGDDVEVGQILLRLDSAQLASGVSRSRAAVSQAEVQVARERASMEQAERELARLEAMNARSADLVTGQALDDALTRMELARAGYQSALHNVDQAQANLEEALERLTRTTLRAPMAGRVTRVNIEEGETAVVGTMNNPGSLLLTISDLSVVEAVLAVDEADIPRVSEGDSAVVQLDAFPDRRFAARVSKIGQSAIGRGMPGQSASQSQGPVDFEVVLTLLDLPAALRPDLSATADIIVASRRGAVAAPIISVTTRPRTGDGTGDGPDDDPDDFFRTDDGMEEGVFLIRDGAAVWQPVELGITGREHFEILSGLEVGDSVVSGPYQRILELRDGQAVRTMGGTGGSSTP